MFSKELGRESSITLGELDLSARTNTSIKNLFSATETIDFDSWTLQVLRNKLVSKDISRLENKCLEELNEILRDNYLEIIEGKNPH